MGFVHHREPRRHRGLGGRDRAPHVGVEDFGSGARQRIQSGGHEPAQRFERRQTADAGDVGHFGRTERMKPDPGEHPFQVAEQLFVEVDAELRMQPALQQQLVAAQRKRLRDLFAVLLARGDEGALRIVGLAVEIAELAARDADVGDIDVAVDLPRHDRRVGDRRTPYGVGRCGQLLHGRAFVERIGFVARERLAPHGLVEYAVGRHVSGGVLPADSGGLAAGCRCGVRRAAPCRSRAGVFADRRA